MHTHNSGHAQSIPTNGHLQITLGHSWHALNSEHALKSSYHYHHCQGFVSLLLEEPFSAYCPAMSIFGNMTPVWTYSLFKVIPPMSFCMTPRVLVVLWAPYCHTFGPPVVFQPWDMLWPLVLVGVNLVDNVNDSCLQVDPTCTFSVTQC